MLNSAACDAKTPRTGVGARYCEKSSRAKGLTPGHRARYRRVSEIIGRYVSPTRKLQLSRITWSKLAT